MEVSSESPRVPPGIGWGIYHFLCPRGRAFAIHLCPGVGAFAIDINSRDFQMLTIFIFTQFYRIKGGGGSGRPPTDNF